MCSYRSEKILLFEIEAEKLSIIFKDELMETFPIGSTPVPALKAKPIIDMMPIVKDISKVDTFNEAMIEAGYELKGKNGVTGRRFFGGGGRRQLANVSCSRVSVMKQRYCTT